MVRINVGVTPTTPIVEVKAFSHITDEDADAHEDFKDLRDSIYQIQQDIFDIGIGLLQEAPGSSTSVSVVLSHLISSALATTIAKRPADPVGFMAMLIEQDELNDEDREPLPSIDEWVELHADVVMYIFDHHVVDAVQGSLNFILQNAYYERDRRKLDFTSSMALDAADVKRLLVEQLQVHQGRGWTPHVPMLGSDLPDRDPLEGASLGQSSARVPVMTLPFSDSFWSTQRW